MTVTGAPPAARVAVMLVGGILAKTCAACWMAAAPCGTVSLALTLTEPAVTTSSRKQSGAKQSSVACRDDARAALADGVKSSTVPPRVSSTLTTVVGTLTTVTPLSSG